MMKKMQLVAFLLLASSALIGCYGHESKQAQDGQSHWLRRCANGNTCEGDELCACGVCTKLCANDNACGSESRCIEVGAGSSCEQAPAGIKRVCLSACESDQTCGSGEEQLSCIDQVCMEQPDEDAGRIGTADAGAVATDAGPSTDASMDASTAQAGSGSAGSGGSAPTQPPVVRPDPVLPHVLMEFRLEGDHIVAHVVFATVTLYMGCAPPIEVTKYVDFMRQPRRDDRPAFYDSPGYYLDGIFSPPNHSLGCDEQLCRPYPRQDLIDVIETYEYVKTGTSAPPPDAVGAPALVDVIERQPLSGSISVGVGYYEDDDCATQSGGGSEITIPVPELGVCCPIGAAECGSQGPAGGWSDKLDHCKPIDSSSTHPYVRQDDPRGCPVLVEDVSSSCADADGGV